MHDRYLTGWFRSRKLRFELKVMSILCISFLQSRIGLFSFLYTVPAAVFLVSLYYLSTPTSTNGVLSSVIGTSRRNTQMLSWVSLVRYVQFSRLALQLLGVHYHKCKSVKSFLSRTFWNRYASNMFFGAALVVWVCSRKTLMTWKSMCQCAFRSEDR